MYEIYCYCPKCERGLHMNDFVFTDEKTKEFLGCIHCLNSETAVNYFEE